jgi:IS30 family transposase
VTYYQLTEGERYQISSILKEGFNQKQIALNSGRSPSTILRELMRNRGVRGYRPKQAQTLSNTRRVGADKAIKLTVEVIDWIERLIRQELSPQQVADYLREEKNISLHHETIYKWIYSDKSLGGDLYTHVRIASKPYRNRYGAYDRRGKLRNRVDIDERPAIVDERLRIGDWEGDTIVGKGQRSSLLTMVERKTLYTVIVKSSGKHAKPLADAAIKAMKAMKAMIETITLDNGLEFAGHERIAKSLDCDIYFARPYSSWERGINENTNGLIRQYFPKGTDFNAVTDKQVKQVMEKLNNRPRKTRGCKSPNELFKGLRKDLLAA